MLISSHKIVGFLVCTRLKFLAMVPRVMHQMPNALILPIYQLVEMIRYNLLGALDVWTQLEYFCGRVMCVMIYKLDMMVIQHA